MEEGSRWVRQGIRLGRYIDRRGDMGREGHMYHAMASDESVVVVEGSEGWEEMACCPLDTA